MASSLKNLSSYDENNLPSAKEMKIGIVVADWNEKITHSLFEGCYKTLIQHEAEEDNIYTIQVPGTFELPAGAKLLLQNKKLDAVVCIGCVIKGETSHNEYINNAVSIGLVNLGIATGVPCIFGVLTPNDEQQAIDRAGGKYGNKGVEAAVTAIRMASVKHELKKTEKKTIGF